jgi:hypothetical protein
MPNLCVWYVIRDKYVKVSTPYLYIFSTDDVAYTQFWQDNFGLPEDGVSEAPKHVGVS